MHRRNAPLALAVVAALAFALAAQGAPEGESLKGKDLKAAGAGGGSITLGSILGDLLRQGTAKGPGKVLGVKVEDDQPGFLQLSVRYSDVSAKGGTLNVVALDRSKRPKTLAEAKVTLPDVQGEQVVNLELPANTPLDTDFRQSLLNVSISAGNRTEASENFDCPKTWRKASLDVTIQAVAIGKELPTQPGGIVFRPLVGGNTPTIAPTTPTFNRSYTLRTFHRPRPVGGGAPANQDGAKGPGIEKVRYLQGMSVDARAPLNEDDLGLPLVIADANKASGYYYYLPSRYHLDWSVDKGHEFSIVYNPAAAEGANSVQMHAVLAADIDPGDLAFVQNLVGRRGLGLKQLVPFPYSVSPEVTLASTLGLYNIKKEQINVTGITEAANYAEISFVTDPVTKESIQLALTGKEGLNGSVDFNYNGDGGGNQQAHKVPVHLHLADERSFGIGRWDRDKPFPNETPYSIKLKYLRYLTAGQYDAVPTIYTYDLKNTVVRQGGSARINGIPKPVVEQQQFSRIWVEYVIEKDDASLQKVVEGITAGVTNINRSEVTVRTLTFQQELMVAFVDLKVSSRYFDTKGTQETIKTINLAKEGETTKLGPLYLGKRQAGEAKPGDPVFKYKLRLTLADGTVKESKEWVECNDLNLAIGKVQVKPVLEQQ